MSHLSPQVQEHRSRALDRMDPRTFREVISTICLAEEVAPQAGAHVITFDAMAAVNERFQRAPNAMHACFKYLDVALTNQGLGTIGGPMILSITEDGILVEG